MIDDLHATHATASPYGTMVIHGVFLHVAILKRDHASIPYELNYMRDHQEIARRVLLFDFNIAGDTDDATEWLRGQLVDPATRGETLGG